MTLTIVTGCWGPRREDYARMFLAGFEKHWPDEVRLLIYADGPISASGRADVRDLADCEGYSEFIARHSGDPVKCGKVPAPGATWKPKDIAAGYNFRFDAVRFAGQGFIPEDAADSLPDGDVLCWLDADVASRAPIPRGWVEGLLAGQDGAYLGRAPKHSEIGFWAVRLNPRTREMLVSFARHYRSEIVFDLSEWHSAYVWDCARMAVTRSSLGLDMRNLTPGGSGHVWLKSPLAAYLEHRKGDRKGFR